LGRSTATSPARRSRRGSTCGWFIRFFNRWGLLRRGVPAERDGVVRYEDVQRDPARLGCAGSGRIGAWTSTTPTWPRPMSVASRAAVPGAPRSRIWRGRGPRTRNRPGVAVRYAEPDVALLEERRDPAPAACGPSAYGAARPGRDARPRPGRGSPVAAGGLERPYRPLRSGPGPLFRRKGRHAFPGRSWVRNQLQETADRRGGRGRCGNVLLHPHAHSAAWPDTGTASGALAAISGATPRGRCAISSRSGDQPPRQRPQRPRAVGGGRERAAGLKDQLGGLRTTAHKPGGATKPRPAASPATHASVVTTGPRASLEHLRHMIPDRRSQGRCRCPGHKPAGRPVSGAQMVGLSMPKRDGRRGSS